MESNTVLCVIDVYETYCTAYYYIYLGEILFWSLLGKPPHKNAWNFCRFVIVMV